MKSKLCFKLTAILLATVASLSLTIAFKGAFSKTDGNSYTLKGAYTQAFASENVLAEEAGETDGEQTAEYAMKTKGMFSVNNDYLLLVTNLNFEDYSLYSEIGYVVKKGDEEGKEVGSDKYYTAVSFNNESGEAVTQDMSEIFRDNVVNGMIVSEIEYDAAFDYTVTPYYTANDGTTTKGNAVNIARKPYTLTLYNPSPDYCGVTFKNGETSVELYKGETLPETDDVTVPKGYTFVGYFDKETGDKYTESTFTMPAKAVTLVPYFKMINRDTLTDFGRPLDFSSNSVNDRIYTLSVNGFSRTTLASGITKTPALIKFENEKQFYAEVPTYNYEGGVQSDWTFIGVAPKVIKADTSYEFTFTFYNFGTEALSFDIYQTNTGGSPTSEVNPHESVTLTPGEIKTIVFNVTGFDNNKIMLFYKFTSTTTSDLSLGVNLFMDK